jgi:serine/threonine protein kinase
MMMKQGDLPVIKLCAFGMTKDMSYDSAPRTQAGTVVFTAPEVLLNAEGHSYDGPAVDVWSIGVVNDCAHAVTH